MGKKVFEVISNEAVVCRYLTFEEVLAAYREERIKCPACGNTRDLSDNGQFFHSRLSFCCGTCGEQFDAVYIAERDS